MSLTLAEQETTITVDLDERLVRIHTTVAKHIRAFDKDDAFTRVDGGDDWAKYTIPEAEWSPITGRKRHRELSDEQRKVLADRLARVRERAHE